MTSFCFLNKAEKEKWLLIFFDLFYENMKDIAPCGASYDEERDRWVSTVSAALDKDPRRIIICSVDGEFAGFLMYYTRGELLMVEELQIKKGYRMTLLFYRLCKHLIGLLPSEVKFIEAYAHGENQNSQGIMSRLGMEEVDDCRYPHLVHFRGASECAKRRLG